MESKFDKLYNQIITEQREVIEEGWLGKAATTVAIGAAALGAANLTACSNDDNANLQPTRKMLQRVQKNQEKQVLIKLNDIMTPSEMENLWENFCMNKLMDQGMSWGKYMSAELGWKMFQNDIKKLPAFKKKVSQNGKWTGDAYLQIANAVLLNLKTMVKSKYLTSEYTPSFAENWWTVSIQDTIEQVKNRK